MPSALFLEARRKFHQELLATVLTIDERGVASNADDGNTASIAIARELIARIGKPKIQKKLAGQTAGKLFEKACTRFLDSTFCSSIHLRPGSWTVVNMEQGDKIGIAKFEQYSHLSDLEKAVKLNPHLATVLGNDYLITPDIVICRKPEADSRINHPKLLVDGSVANKTPLRDKNCKLPLLHASISCKWTLRSDRAQNARSEALNLIRNRKGRSPHIVSISGEPLPGRLASLALGTSDLDCVYHFALPELQDVINKGHYPDSKELLHVLVEGKRLRDISDLPLDLCI